MEPIVIKKILLIVDGGEGDKFASAAAIDLALLFHAKLIVLNIVDKSALNRMKRFVEQTSAELEIELEEKGWRAMYHIEEISKGRGVPTLIIQRTGLPDREIVSEAERIKADLIVLSAARQSAGQARRLNQGYVEAVVENAPCAVLVVKN